MKDVYVGQEAILNTYFSYIGCNKCGLSENRYTKDVFAGAGSASADIMFLFDAPSEEDRGNLQLMSGEAGRLFMNMLEMAWFEDDEEIEEIRNLNGESYFEELREAMLSRIFLAPVVACPTYEGRAVAKDQAEACRERVWDLIYAVDPMIIVCLGDLPFKYVFGVTKSPNSYRGFVRDLKLKSKFSNRELRYPVILTHHPRKLCLVGDQNLVEFETGVTYEALEDLKKVINIVKTYKEVQNEH